MDKISAIISLLRPSHWVKNLLIFFPAFFAGKILNKELGFSLIIVFIVFSILASSVYIINDIKDLEQDKKHPQKKNRAIASGKISIIEAIFIFITIFIIAFSLVSLFETKVLHLFIVYFGLNLLYTFYLKKLQIIDVFIVSFMFILRLLIGSQDANVLLSKWLILVVFFFSLIFSFGKRRDDILLRQENEDGFVRLSAKKLSIELVNYIILILMVLGINSYIIYCLIGSTYGNEKEIFLLISIALVLIITIEYLKEMFVEKNTGSPVALLFKNKSLLISSILFIIDYIYIIYF